MEKAVNDREVGDQRLKADWEERSKREGLQTVTSVRWDEEEISRATSQLKAEIGKFLKDQFDEDSLKSFLEIGCGVGRILDMWEEKIFPPKINGIDISEGMIEKAQKNARLSRSTGLHVKDAAFLNEKDIEELKADLVYSVTVLEHVVDGPNFIHTIENMKKMSNKYIMLIEEAHPHKTMPSTYTRTDMIRSISEYIKVMEPWSLIKFDRHIFIDDLYCMFLFKKEKEGRF